MSDDRTGQSSLFDRDEFLAWKEDWRGMPTYSHRDLTPWKTVLVHFESREDMEALSRILGQTLTERTQSIWFPEAQIGRMVDKRYRDASDDRRMPESPTRSRIYSDWANHETWWLCLLILDDEERRRAAFYYVRLHADDTYAGEAIAVATEDLTKAKGYDPAEIAWAEIAEEVRAVMKGGAS